MASNIDNSSTFRVVAGFAAFLLVGAAALIYLQSGGGSPSAPQLAALSQAIPAQASRALNGDTRAFNELDASVKNVASCGVAAPRGGRPTGSNWNLEPPLFWQSGQKLKPY